MDAYLQFSDGKVVPITVKGTTTVGWVRRKALEMLRAPPELVTIQYGDRELTDDDTLLADVGLTAEGVVLVAVSTLAPEEEEEALAMAARTDLSMIRNRFPAAVTNRKVVMRCVERRGRCLAHAQMWKDDVEVVHTALAQNPRSISFAGESFRGDRDLIRDLLDRDPRAYSGATEALLRDRKFALEAIGKGCPVLCVSKAHKNDKEVVLAAVKKHWPSLSRASATLRADREVVNAAMQQCEAAYNLASEDLKCDSALALQAFKTRHDIHLHPKLAGDKSFLLPALKSNPAYPVNRLPPEGRRLVIHDPDFAPYRKGLFGRFYR
eukprot:Sspe_Gene.101509::Locus_76096_Transcript_1_1_Confidence_1.000_Length_1215::g.101509::m.101509